MNQLFLAFLETYSVPEPEAEFMFHDTRRWRFDYAWPQYRLALEVQDGLFTGGRHVQGAALLKEHEKLNAAAIAGWRVLFKTPKDLCKPQTIRLLSEAMNTK